MHTSTSPQSGRLPAVDDEMRERIRNARALPSPPVITARLIELCEDPDSGINDVIELLANDPALTARLLRLANSPLYARRRRTDNLRQAVTLLGLDVVLTASLSLTMAATRHDRGNTSPLFAKRRWARSVHAASAAQLIAERVPDVHPTDAFLAALLQDIGVQVVVQLSSDTYRPCDPHGTHDDLVAAEMRWLGVDHAALGAELLDAWNLPDHVVDAVRWSHEVADEEAPLLAVVVSVGGLVADGIGGDAAAFDRACELCADRLSIDAAEFTARLSYLANILPDLAAILDADAPPADVLADLAEEAIVLRRVMAQAEANELQQQVKTLSSATEELKAQIRLDSLTGLANRRQLDEVLAREFVVAKKHEFPLSILFVDLDDFKLVNDRFGHTVGDELLVQTARRISASVRDGDHVGRFGGEEFVVVLPGTDRYASEIVAKRLVDRFNERRFTLSEEVTIAQTASIGIATLDDTAVYRTTAELLHAADVALYDAKAKGKNQWRRGEYVPSVDDDAGVGATSAAGHALAD